MQEHEYQGRDSEGEAHRQRSTDLRDRDRLAEQQILIRGGECRTKQVEPDQQEQECSTLRRLRAVVHRGNQAREYLKGPKSSITVLARDAW